MVILCFLFGAILTNGYKFLHSPQDAMVEQIYSYNNSLISKWQVDYLLKVGISPGKKDKNGLSAYMSAFIYNNTLLMEKFPAHMTQDEKEELLSRIRDWSTNDISRKKTAITALKKSIDETNEVTK